MAGVGRVGVDTAGGIITGPGVPSVKVNGSTICVKGDNVAAHGTGPHAAATMVGASSTVFAGGIGVCRAGDAASCGDTLTPGSSDVNAG